MFVPLMLGVLVIVTGGIWSFETQKRKKDKRKQEWENKWVGVNQKEEKDG